MINRHSGRLFRRLVIFLLLLVAMPATWPGAATARVHAPLAAAPGVSAANASPIEFVDSFGGIIESFVVSDTIAFLNQGNTLIVLDVSIPAAPTPLGHMPLMRDADELAVADGIVYVASLYRMQIIDAHNPALPVELARYTPRQGVVYSIQVAGGSAYLRGPDGIEIVDIRTPARPIYRGKYAQSTGIANFFAVGTLVYVVDRTNVLRIVDLSDPSVPKIVGLFSLPFQPTVAFNDVAVEGQRAYINGNTMDGSGNTQPRLITLDVTRPNTPVLLGNVEISSFSATIAGNIAYLEGVNGLQIMDISDPAHPIAHGTYPGKIVHSAGGELVQVVGSRVYFVDNLETLKMLEAGDIDNASLLGSYATPQGLKYPSNLQVAGNLTFVASRGLQIVDLTNPISPTLRGFYPSEYANFLHVAGTHAYLDKNSSVLELLDISNPDLPTLVTTLSVGLVQAVEEIDNRAYILTSELEGCGKFCIVSHNTLTIVDVSNPSVPVVQGRIRLFDSGTPLTGDAVAHSGYVYIAWGDGLRIVDPSNPAAPVVRANYPIAGGVSAIQIVGTLAYVADNAGLIVLDLADPLNPMPLGHTGAMGYAAYSIQVQGSLAFVGNSLGVRVIDISDPKRLIPRAAYDEVAGSVRVAGDTIYVAGDTAGLHVLRLHPDRFPPPMFMPLARH